METPTVQLPQLLTAREVCLLFRVCPRTLDYWLSAGKFPSPVPRPGRKRLWKADDVRSFLEER
jgi:hypothetical protein